ncbi:3-hydroxybenzoate 6-hydroxylase 1 [Sulfitobacter sp. THAF37]|uniref:FAD-dependent monooxygenase n=1 Tax=Sulfitobacter sp. THAF37 TaxID=2587855 RepID=UPI0012678B21|nr:FAD-dependent monooxygenase [Sulfitobacter sp. THAF37]QFT60100.1 3-hydroxybenzoate 6-hydroxylase 1 [Sulfitobacter sp. THAF37]
MRISNAIVIGAGIGGLAVAAALARRGVAVTVLERAGRLGEVGAGLQVSPNGLAVLRALGLEAELTRKEAVAGRAVVLQTEKGREVARLDLQRLRPDQRYVFLHRADLVDMLAGLARRANVSFEFGTPVASVRPGALPQVQLEGGGTRQAEVVIAADGIHSVARPVLNGADQAAFTGQVAWRALVENMGGHPAEARVGMGPGRHLVSYPVRGGRLVNLVAVEERESWAAEGWNHADDPAHLRAAFNGFSGPAGELIAAVREVTLWGLHRHPVAEVWQRDGVALLGDAAHPTLPFLAQGANMALEDAWVLAERLAERGQAGLAAYQAARRERVRRVIRASSRNAWRYHLRPGPLRLAAHLGLGAASRFAPGLMVGAFDWLYGRDVTRE